MNKIYEHLNDLHVRATFIYQSSSEDGSFGGDPAYAYADPDCTTKIDVETLEDIFLKGCIIIRGNEYTRPDNFSRSNGIGYYREGNLYTLKPTNE